MADMAKEVLDLAKRLNASFHHIKRLVNDAADCLAEGAHQSLFISHDSLSRCFLVGCFISFVVFWWLACECISLVLPRFLLINDAGQG